jgi:hypothetical protein
MNSFAFPQVALEAACRERETALANMQKELDNSRRKQAMILEKGYQERVALLEKRLEVEIAFGFVCTNI